MDSCYTICKADSVVEVAQHICIAAVCCKTRPGFTTICPHFEQACAQAGGKHAIRFEHERLHRLVAVTVQDEEILSCEVTSLMVLSTPVWLSQAWRQAAAQHSVVL